MRDELVAAHGEDRFPTVVADMSSIAAVRAAVTRIRESEPRLDVLVDNAGAMFPDRRETSDGLEATFATMVVGPFVLVPACCPSCAKADEHGDHCHVGWAIRPGS